METSYPQGYATGPILEGLENLRDQAKGMAKDFGDLGVGIHDFGGEIVSAKLNGIIGLSWLAGELAWAALMGPAGPFAEQAAIAAARTFFQLIGEKLTFAIGAILRRFITNAGVRTAIAHGLYEALQEGVVEIFQGTTQELGVQAYLIEQEYKDGFDGEALFQNAWISGFAGAAGGVAGFGLHSGARRLPWRPDRWGGLGRGAIVGAGAGAFGALAAWVATGWSTGDWTLDPRMITGGVLGGIGPSMLYGWRGGSDYSGAPMTPDDYRRLVVGRQDPGPETGPDEDGTAPTPGATPGSPHTPAPDTAGSSSAAPGPAGPGPDSAAGSARGAAAGGPSRGSSSDPAGPDTDAHPDDSDAGEGDGDGAVATSEDADGEAGGARPPDESSAMSESDDRGSVSDAGARGTPAAPGAGPDGESADGTAEGATGGAEGGAGAGEGGAGTAEGGAGPAASMGDTNAADGAGVPESGSDGDAAAPDETDAGAPPGGAPAVTPGVAAPAAGRPAGRTGNPAESDAAGSSAARGSNPAGGTAGRSSPARSAAADDTAGAAASANDGSGAGPGPVGAGAADSTAGTGVRAGYADAEGARADGAPPDPGEFPSRSGRRVNRPPRIRIRRRPETATRAAATGMSPVAAGPTPTVRVIGAIPMIARVIRALPRTVGRPTTTPHPMTGNLMALTMIPGPMTPRTTPAPTMTPPGAPTTNRTATTRT